MNSLDTKKEFDNICQTLLGMCKTIIEKKGDYTGILDDMPAIESLSSNIALCKNSVSEYYKIFTEALKNATTSFSKVKQKSDFDNDNNKKEILKNTAFFYYYVDNSGKKLNQPDKSNKKGIKETLEKKIGGLKSKQDCDNLKNEFKKLLETVIPKQIQSEITPCIKAFNEMCDHCRTDITKELKEIYVVEVGKKKDSNSPSAYEIAQSGNEKKLGDGMIFSTKYVLQENNGNSPVKVIYPDNNCISGAKATAMFLKNVLSQGRWPENQAEAIKWTKQKLA